MSTTTDVRPHAPTRPDRLAFIGPNWFAAVMGTGIVANAAATLPLHVPALLVAARLVWALDTLLLLVVSTAFVLHWRRYPETARGHLDDPLLSHFYGAPAMALLTVGAGALLVGVPVVGEPLALTLSATLWVAGTVFGLATAVVVPFRMFTTHQYAAGDAFGGWLMPVVPPMVSAATGPLLLPYLPAGQWRETLQLLCLAMFGLALLASLVIITLVWQRLVHHGLGPAAAVPTLFIVLGPVGQSMTAAHTLGASAVLSVPAPDAAVARVLAVVYAAPMWGFAMLWLALAAAVTVRTARRGLPFSLTWWSFTFPVGTVVTGTSGLAAGTGAGLFAVVAVLLYAALVAAWATVAARTLRGVRTGALLVAPR